MKRFRLPLPLLVLLLSCPLLLPAQARYANPVLHADYSDPDVCRVGEDYYMTASSFNCFPGLPILHSRDLVHWELAGAALSDYPGPDWYGPDADFHGRVQHGNGVWAPAIRYHDGWFYIFCGDPDRGIFMVRTQDPRGRWEDPVWVVKAKGFIDPCPLWDEDGRAWLSHAAAGSRAGLKSVVFVAPMSPDGTRLLGPSRIVYDGHKTQPTIEGTKFYKRDGRYYIFAPAGGVKTGWQTVLRAESPYGPYEERIVMASAEGTINGPHQGGWVETAQGEHWFLHFQDKGAYGRIVHLQPMTWRSDGWPLIGEDPDGDGIGQPVASYRIPGVAMHPAGGPGGAAGSFDASRSLRIGCRCPGSNLIPTRGRTFSMPARALGIERTCRSTRPARKLLPRARQRSDRMVCRWRGSFRRCPRRIGITCCPTAQSACIPSNSLTGRTGGRCRTSCCRNFRLKTSP